MMLKMTEEIHLKVIILSIIQLYFYSWERYITKNEKNTQPWELVSQ